MDKEGLDLIQSKEYLEKVKKVSDFINSLPPSQADNEWKQAAHEAMMHD